MRNIVSVVCAALVVGACNVFADDAVGIMEVSVPDGAPVPFGLPFEPLGDGRPGSFLSGPFAGDGDAARSDVLLHFYSESVTGAVRTATAFRTDSKSPGDRTRFLPNRACRSPGRRASSFPPCIPAGSTDRTAGRFRKVQRPTSGRNASIREARRFMSSIGRNRR